MTTRRSDVRRRAIKHLMTLREQRAIKREIEDHITQAQEAALDGIDTLGLKSLSFDHDIGDSEIRITGTRVEGTTLIFDEARLRKALGQRGWNAVSTRTLDRSKLEAAVADGRVDPRTVAECSEERPKKAYIRLTEKTK